VERVLAQSGHSRVYLARDASGRLAALKELHFALVPGAQEVEAFEREADTLASLAHPAIPRFLERFTEGAGVGLRLYLATEFIAGESLADRLDRGPLPADEALALARTLLDLLVWLQQRTPALFHRDLKPANVMFRQDGAVVLVDFGSARQVEGSRTHRSTLVGTFGYMPPEQLGGTVDRTSDVYALGATLLHAVTGRPPAELLEDGFTLVIPAAVPPALRGWLERALAVPRERRFPDARTALAALAGRPRRRPLPWLAPALTMALVAGASIVLTRERPLPPVAAPVVSPPAAQAWFARVRSSCNNLEVGGAMARSPPPAGADGMGFGAGCYALAGRHGEARRLIASLPTAPERTRAAWRVFEIAHPVADQGDDDAAGPMMELVLESWPDNYQALYHAGISEYGQGDTVKARARLEDFLRRYTTNDNFTAQARTVLQRIEQGLPPDPSLGLGRH
jgi:serine/threonine protein kinase